DAHVVRVDAVELEAPRRLVGAEVGELERLLAALGERPRRDHLTHVEPGAEAFAQLAEWPVGDAGHRGEDDRRRDAELSEAHLRELPGACRRHVAVDLALVDLLHGARPSAGSGRWKGYASRTCPRIRSHSSLGRLRG